MRSVIRAILVLTILGSLIILGLSVWPGVLTDLLLVAILLSVFWVPLAFIGLVIAIIKFVDKLDQGPLSRASIAEALAIPCVAMLASAALAYDIPRQVVFRACRPAFEAAVANTPVSDDGVAFRRRIGIYYVDERAVDPRGGAYFRVFAGGDGIGPDEMSYGFVKQPNILGTPFGIAHYKVVHVVDDWYWFQASND